MKAIKILLSQFSSPLIYVLVAASAVTWLIGDTLDALIIAAAVVLNTALGFFQEYKAERSLQALKKYLTPKAKVIREGKRQVIEASEVAAGDICVLEVGERVPADGVLIEAEKLVTNEAVLTGESLPVGKSKGAPVYMGTIISGGIGKMRVEKVGGETRFGQIAQTLKATREPATPLQKQLGRFSKKLTWMLGAICAAIFVLGLWRGDPLIDIFTTSVAIAVSAIPEGLAIALTVILAIGMQRILKRKALVRKLLAAETLGSVTVICCDKTGTLTEGRMQVVKALTDDEALLRKAAAWCNDQRDPLELAMLEWAGQESGQRLDALPFDHEKKFIATLHPGRLFVSGAPEVILAKCGLNRLPPEFAQEAKKGHRLVGFAYKNLKSKITHLESADVSQLTWLGALVFADPIRPGVKAVLERARDEGLKIKLVTGDYQETAEAVARELGIAKGDVFGRVDPQQKLKIVEELQAQGEVVAMMGDGVNDAPALKKADIGIVVAQASAVATETADMVLLDSNFATILTAVEQGRLIFANLIKVVLFLMADAFAEVIAVGGSLLLNLPLPLTAAQILWINLVNDSTPAFALALEAGDGRRVRRELLNRQTKISVAVASGLTGAIGLVLFYVFGSAVPVFTLIAVAPLGYSLVIGSVKNLFLLGSVGLGLLLQILVLYQPGLQLMFKTRGLTVTEWLAVLAAAVMITLGVKLTRHDRP